MKKPNQMSDTKQAEPSALQSVIGKSGDFLEWIKEQLQDPEVRKATLLDIGLDPDKGNKEQPIEGTTEGIEAYRNSVDPDKESYESAIKDLMDTYDSLKEFIEAVSDDPTKVDEYVRLLLEILGTNYVRLHFPSWYWMFQLLGVLAESGVSAHKAERKQGIVYENLWNFASNPIGYIPHLIEHHGKTKDKDNGALGDMDDAHAWSSIFLALSGLLAYLEMGNKGPESRYLYGWDVVRPGEEQSPKWEDRMSEGAFSFDFRLPEKTEKEEDEKENEKYIGASMLFVSKEDAPVDFFKEKKEKPSGGFYMSLNGEVSQYFKLNDNWNLILEFDTANALDTFISKKSKLDAFGDGKIGVGVERIVNKETGISYQLPETTGSRLEVGGILISSFLSKEDAGLEVSLKNNTIVISGQSADNFLKEILPDRESRLDFSFGVGVSKKRGFYLNNDVDLDSLKNLLKTSSPDDEEVKTRSLDSDSDKEVIEEKPDAEQKALEGLFPINKDMGLVTFESIRWTYGQTIKDNSYGINIGVLSTFITKLGPVYIQVDKIGVGLDLSFPKETGISDSSFDFGFTPPKGVALRVDSEVISGGGFLELDYDNHRYAGVLALRFWEIELVAIGLINTRLPNNQKGFSMLISISVLFEPAIQLSFGFTLNGVGGLIGIHRTMKVDVLRERIRSGSITSIMFPENVLENAPKVISDLRAIFPPQKNHYVIAPFLRIGYGSPTIVEVDLGILIEVPFKGRLILLGSVGVYLPSKKVNKKLVEIHVDIFGDFNFAESYILIEGRLRDSQIVGIPLSGGFAFVLDWGNKPQFLFSIGGYHPRYKKPARFPDIPRLTAQIKKGKTLQLTCKYYQAITSNTYQIGFSAEIVVKKGKAKARGFLGFNTLIQFDPFYFETDVSISVSISYRGRNFCGVDLAFLLSGPKPWRAQGYAKIKLLFFSLKIRFNITWGGEQKVQRTTIKPAKLLVDLSNQLEAANSWSGKFPVRYLQAESLRTLEATEQDGKIFMHPSGYMELRQNLIPLNRTIEKLGNNYVENRPTYKIENFKLGKGKVEKVGRRNMLTDHFSRGQFEELSDDEKLSTVDFDPMKAGLKVSAENAFDISKEMQSTSNGYEDILLEEEVLSKMPKRKTNWQLDRGLNFASSKRSIDTERAELLFGVVDNLPTEREKGYRIVSIWNLEPPEGITVPYFQSYSEAKDHLEIYFSKKIEEWQIIEVTEEVLEAVV